jgi:two-component system, NtrC family, sensor kinase
MCVTLHDLKATQALLVEQEKLASLGQLVAGVAHEINTPLGIAVLSYSVINEAVEKLNADLSTETLTLERLKQNLDDISEANHLVELNLSKANHLISNFKQVAVDKTVNRIVEFNLKEVLDLIASSLKLLLESKRVSINIDVDPTIEINNNLSDFSQVISNLLNNAVQHAFTANTASNLIVIESTLSHGTCQINISDNGKGIDSENKHKIFEPFFTTNRKEGNTGLGLSIVYNIVKEKLNGQIEVQSELGKGTHFNLTIANAPHAS